MIELYDFFFSNRSYSGRTIFFLELRPVGRFREFYYCHDTKCCDVLLPGKLPVRDVQHPSFRRYVTTYFYIQLPNPVIYYLLLCAIGGTYGYVRVTMGIYMGYISGCSEIFSSVVLHSVTILLMGSSMTSIFGTTPLLEPLWWLICTALAAIPIVHNRYFWTLNATIGTFVIFCLLFYCFTPVVVHTSIPLHMTRESVSYFDGGLKGFFSTLAPAVLLYLGIEIFPLMSEDVHSVCITYVL
jgi:hypothetical protein